MTSFRGERRKKLDYFKGTLKRSDVKLTHQRMVIFQEVAEMESHPDAESIHRAVRETLPMISLDTVYRTLWLLEDLGLIRSLGARDRVRFDGNMKPHHHFVCRECGEMRDFCSSEYDQLKIPKIVEGLGEVETAQVEVRGICVECSKKAKSRKRVSRSKEKK
jgi:Fur family transcriptional regulator, peroxide stress response regulator